MSNPEQIPHVPRVELTSEYSISRILKGGWQLAGGHGPIDHQAAIEDMFKFVETGITTFDFGDIYTGVEEMVGDFLRAYRRRFGSERVKDIQLDTKYVPDLTELASVDRGYTERVIDRSLTRLGVDALDLVQFHWWDYTVPRHMEVANYLADLQKAGKIRHIGVTNFDVDHLQEIVSSGVRVISNQVQYSVLDQRPKKGMVEYAKQNDIKLLCYGTVAGGFLSERYLGVVEPEEPLENRSLVKYKLIIDDFGGWDLFQELLATLSKVAQKHGVSMTNVATRYILEQDQVAGVIIGARNANHLQDNLRTFGFEFDQEDKDLLEEITGKYRGLEGDIYTLERDKEGRHGKIMKYNFNKD